MRHFQTGPLEAAFDIEALVEFRAVKNRLRRVSLNPENKTVQERETNRQIKTYLITPNISSHKVQRLNNPQPQLLALLSLLDSNILNMTNQTERMNKLALDDQTPGPDNPIRAITHNKQVILVCS